MQTTRDSATAVQAAILARLIHGEAARPMIEQAERVAQAVETDRQRAILWLHQTLNHETVTCVILMALSDSTGGWSTLPTPWAYGTGRACGTMRSESRLATTPTCLP